MFQADLSYVTMFLTIMENWRVANNIKLHYEASDLVQEVSIIHIDNATGEINLNFVLAGTIQQAEITGRIIFDELNSEDDDE